jgi:K+-sensing histidine kinase KdpD
MDSAHLKVDDDNLFVIKDFLNITLKEIMSLLDAESGSLFVFDSEKNELVLDSYFNSRDIHVKNIKRRIGEGVSGKVIEIKSPVLVRDIDRDPRFRKNGFDHYHTKSFISIPLFRGDRLLGLINIADKTTGGPFSEKDLQFAVTLCKYACVVVESMCLSEEKQKSEKNKELLEKYASVGKLAAGVVHEINNPLDGIIRYTNILLSQIDHNSSTREYLLEVKKGLSRIANITKSLLEFSHLINSDSPNFRKHIDIDDLIDETLDVLKDKCANIRIVKKYGTGLPRIVDMGVGLFHVMVNIIKNAIDAMPGGGVLAITTEFKDSMLYISFKDTGTGIPQEIKDRIFEPFFTTKNINKGTGLGLAICNEIISKYEGVIKVESSPTEGSVFTVLLPKKHLSNV